MATSAAPSLSLRSLFQVALDRTGLVSSAPVLAGLTPAAKALAVAAAAHRVPVLLVVPTDREIEAFVEDIRFFLAALESLSEADVERAVLAFPSQEVDPYRGLAPHFEVASTRARALHGLARGTARVVVASAGALGPRVSGPERVLAAAIEVAQGQEIEPTRLVDLLVDAGYAREDPVDEHGEFCVRGGVVDFFPAGAREPTRLEFIGDTIESIRAYDPSTQRSTQPLDQASILPLQELLADSDTPDRSATAFDYLWAGGKPIVLLSEPDEIRTHGEKLTQQIQASYEEAIAKGHPAPAPSELMLTWDEASPWLEAGTRLETLSLEEATHIACQPSLEFAGR